MLKYFPEGFNAYEFDEHEMNRIIACAFKSRDVQNMVKTVVREAMLEQAKKKLEEIKEERCTGV